MPLLSTTTGEETVSDANSKVYLFHSPKADESDLKEQAVSAVAKEGVDFLRRVGTQTVVSAVIGVYPEIGGQWWTTNYEIAEGEILKVYATKKHSWKRVHATACQFIRMRAAAPCHKLRVKLLGLGSKTRLKYATFTGRFDLLTLEEAQELGVKVNPAYHHTFIPGEVAKLFDVEVLEEALKPKDEIQTVVIDHGEGKKTTFQREEKLWSLDM